MKFNLKAPFQPAGDQSQAIEKLVQGVKAGRKHQVLLGVTGSGKTFTVSNVIAKIGKPTLIISHNKTLAAQLYQEYRDFFPENAVGYFVSYYDYYQPEAYIPQTDTYIEKETQVNQLIDKLRLSATTNLLTRHDVIIVASVSCIYNLGSPVEYERRALTITPGSEIPRQILFGNLSDLQYNRSDTRFERGTFRVRGELVDVWPASEDRGLRMTLIGNTVDKITWIDPVAGTPLAPHPLPLTTATIYPAKHYLTDSLKYQRIFDHIRGDLTSRVKELEADGKILQAHRLSQRVNYDLEMLAEVGYVNGVENYSRYFDGRNPSDPPHTLLDYFKMCDKEFLVIIDESHISIPQIRGMYAGDRARKQTLIDYGFRLPAAIDNRPLKWPEFLDRTSQIIYTSATPDEWEIGMAGAGGVIEQLIRPTGLIDPEIEVRPQVGQVPDLTLEILKRQARRERVLVTTLTKKTAEDLSEYLSDNSPRVTYLHSDIPTLDRQDILDQLRRGEVDVLIGINLLREGLDLPEVSLVAILDADQEGFLRSKTSLIQTMGRAARHAEGRVILYAQHVTGSMQAAISEVNRRRQIQIAYNLKHNIMPKTIVKPIRDKIIDRPLEEIPGVDLPGEIASRYQVDALDRLELASLTPPDRKILIRHLNKQMLAAADRLDFEQAAQIRDKVNEVKLLN